MKNFDTRNDDCLSTSWSLISKWELCYGPLRRFITIRKDLIFCLYICNMFIVKMVFMGKKVKKKLGSNLKNLLQKYIWWFYGVVIAFGLVMVMGMSLMLWYVDKPIPGVMLGNIDAGNMPRESIIRILENQNSLANNIQLNYENRNWVLSLRDIGWLIDSEQSANQAVNWGKGITELEEMMQTVVWGKQLPIVYHLSEGKFESELDRIAGEINTPAIPPQVIVWDGTSEILIEQGTVGKQVLEDELEDLLRANLRFGVLEAIDIPVEVMDMRISSDEKERMRRRAENLLGSELSLVDDSYEVAEADTSTEGRHIWKGKDLVKLIAKDDGFNQELISAKLENIADEVNREPRNAEFVINDENGRVEQFKPEVIGRTLDMEKTVEVLMNKLSLLEGGATAAATLSLSFQETHPEVTASEVNELGIRELLGRGTSEYAHSIAGRMYNVALGSERINGVLVEPGEVFSFNDSVGEVSVATGYKKSYVIKSGATVLDDGGGMCQVSTTVFRAALDAGLPILERKAHSYRVGYYEQDSKPGVDATVYAPSVDLLFENDTPGHILVQTLVDESIPKLTVEIFGTSDGRTVEISEPRVWDLVEPPEDLYVDDLSLDPGEVKQIEYKAWGAKAAFDWKVIRDGEVLQERTFYSNYRPWGAVYLRGVGQ